MKTIRTTILAAFFLAAFTFGTSAQQGMKKHQGCQGKKMHQQHGSKMGMKCCNTAALPDLTEEQTKAIKNIKLECMKENMPLKNKMNELRAKLQTLVTAEVVDNAAINKTIDEITRLKNEMMKNRIEKRFEVKKVLTEEQKIIFNAHYKMNKCCKGGMNKGMGQRAGCNR